MTLRIFVPRDADAAALEAARVAVENGLDDVHARAYALIGSADPGAKALPAADRDGAGSASAAARRPA